MSEKYEAEVPIMARSSTDSDEMQTQALLLEQNHQAQRKINRTRRIILISLLCAIPIIGISAFMHQGGSDYISKVATSSSAKWWSSQMDTTAEGLLPKCTRTFKYYFSGYKGFNSEFGIFTRAALYAKENGYELLLESQPDWVYGKYSDYFEQPVPSCILDPSDDFRRRRAGDEGWNDPKHHPHIAMTRGQAAVVDMWLIEKYVDVPALADLPPLDLERPLPWDQTVPLGYAAAYVALHETFHQVWRAKPVLAEMVGEVATEFGLSGDVQRGHVIGVHYRGGDKFSHECTKANNCGNATIYLETAISTLEQLPEPSCSTCKPTIALMTVEPEALGLFQENPLAERFEIKTLPPSVHGFQTHDQFDFMEWPVEQRIDDTLTMMRDLTVLALHADAFILTASSNVGIVGMMMAGPERIVRSTDQRFLPLTRTLEWYRERKIIQKRQF